jgi:hypothetical protein
MGYAIISYTPPFGRYGHDDDRIIGHIDLDTRISDESLLGQEFSQSNKGDITVRHCLLHNAGFPPDVYTRHHLQCPMHVMYVLIDMSRLCYSLCPVTGPRHSVNQSYSSNNGIYVH